jgi:hypothetical protein
MTPHEALSMHFNKLQLPEYAQTWLIDLWDIIQGLDDWYDGDEVTPQSKEETIYKALVLFPSNPFYLQCASQLAPIMSNMVLKWSAANKKEMDGTADAKSFAWRASYYDVILEVVRIVHGPWKALEISDYVANMYGEDYTEYLKEFQNA